MCRFPSGSTPVPLRFRSGSAPVPLRFHSGSTPVYSGSAPVPLRFRSGSTPVPLRYRSGSAPVLLRFRSGFAPVPLRSCSLYKEGLFLVTLLSETAVSRRARLQWSSLWLSLETRVSGRMHGSTWIVVVVRLDRNADMLYCLKSVEWSLIYKSGNLKDWSSNLVDGSA